MDSLLFMSKLIVWLFNCKECTAKGAWSEIILRSFMNFKPYEIQGFKYKCQQKALAKIQQKIYVRVLPKCE